MSKQNPNHICQLEYSILKRGLVCKICGFMPPWTTEKELEEMKINE